MKKIVTLLLTLAMALGLVGCGFSVGSSNSAGDYEEVFTDAAANQGKAYKNSHMVYNFSLDGMGEMQVYVDTTNGHSFELVGEEGGFNINDKDGNVVFYARCVNTDAYSELTSALDQTATYNGRQFFASYNGDGSTDMFCYLADVGLDCGFVMETHGDDASVFSLVAFRGNPIDGASSDPYAYKGQSAAIDDIEDIEDDYLEDEIETDTDTDVASSESLTNVAVSDEVADMLAKLDTDFNKINWGVIYSISDDFPGLVVSIAPCYEYGAYKLIVGLTNLTDKPLDFTGSAIALDAEGNEEGSTFMYIKALGSANTYIQTINCGQDMPTGVIRWSDCDLEISETSKYTPWEADYSASGKPADGAISVVYEIYSANNETLGTYELYALVLDANGNVLGVGYDYGNEELAAGEKYTGSANIYNDGEVLQGAADIAIFANPTVFDF